MGKQSKVEKHYEMEKGKDDKNLREKWDWAGLSKEHRDNFNNGRKQFWNQRISPLGGYINNS